MTAYATFHPLGPSHLSALLIFALGIPVVIAIARQEQARSQRRYSRGFALAIAALVLPMQLYSMLPSQWSIAESLPLHLCDIACFTAIYALWTGRRWASTAVYYWGLTLTSQALLTPRLTNDFPHLEFIFFWTLHWLIVWSAVYLTWGKRSYPTWRDYRHTFLLSISWMILTLIFNAAFATNYGFLNRKPEMASALDLLGDWPWYLMSEVLLAAIIWALMTWPFERRCSNGQR